MNNLKDKYIILIIVTGLIIATIDFILYHHHSISDSLKLIYILLSALVIVLYINKLREENNRQRNVKHFIFNIMDNLPVGVMAYNWQGKLVFINKACQNLLGISHTDVVGQSVEEVARCFKANICASIVRFVLDTGKSVHDQRISLKTGKDKELACRVDVYPLVDHGEYSGAICIICDITAELNYNDLKRISDIILRDMASGVVAVNNQKEIIMFNQAAEEITGLRAEEVIGRSFHEVLVNKSNRDCLLCEAVHNNQKIKGEEIWYNINGKEFCTLNTAEVLMDEHDNFLGAICVFQDITEFKNRHDVMIKQEKLAVVGQLAAGMAHEVRNPLTAVRGFAQLLAERHKDSNREIVNIMISELDRTEKIISDFLRLARPKDPEYKETDINQLIEKNCAIVNSECVYNNITVCKNLAGDLPLVWVDEDQITQVLLNITHNAIEAMQEKGKGKLTISTFYSAASNDICIEICDTGNGIAKNKLAKLGTPFFTTKSNGTGLGLAISYEIIRRHHGRIEVASEVDVGTCFKVFLPVNGA
ncbi:PAS domain S-box-containing protein [Desulfohalotomaculum tongense]|uniref:PAS domain-containing sensor histidine kinase n=1 Tax=Desulforadius tongensis TaxID=1216062 RepID=UPI00195CB674|nr:PAS domain-containing protein [Desulforadius tongensis]MBM7855639.1 PAS domain S-box-containing protein [Desulforadius tongensis]